MRKHRRCTALLLPYVTILQSLRTLLLLCSKCATFLQVACSPGCMTKRVVLFVCSFDV